MKRLADYKVHFAVAALALASWGLLRLQHQRAAQLTASDNNIDYFSSGYYKKQMNEHGLPKNELTAVDMRHNKNDGVTYLTQSIMTLFSDNGAAPWVIQGDSAVLAADGDHLNLNGKALISRAKSPRASALTVNTSDLRVTLTANYAETDQWAEIISPPNRTEGVGMQTTFASPILLNLSAKVQGRYVFH